MSNLPKEIHDKACVFARDKGVPTHLIISNDVYFELRNSSDSFRYFSNTCCDDGPVEFNGLIIATVDNVKNYIEVK